MTGQPNRREDLKGQFRKYLSDNFELPAGEEGLRDDASLLEEGVLDSTGVLNVVMFIEETFGIEVEDEELVPENLDSIDKLVAFVERKTGRGT